MTSATCKPSSFFPFKPLATAVLLVFSANVQTAPILEGVLGNNLDMDVSLPGTAVITQTVNQRDVITWRDFSIGSGETVRFVQPGANSVILNRVVGGNSSEIFGSLVANGRIFLINPSGIVFGAGSQVNVGSLVASTLNLKGNGNSNGQMPSQTIEFEANADARGILNAGSITAKDIVFLAPSITNTGNLTAGLQPQHLAGSGVLVSLIAAKEVTVNTSGSDLVVQSVEGHNNALIQQLGQVLAEGGRIVLLASASNNGDPSVINTAGVNQASRISIEGDLIRLTGSLNVGNPQGTVDVIAGEVGQIRNGQSAALLSDGDLNINSRGGLSLNNAGNDFTGLVDLTATGSVAVHDSNNLQVSVNSGGEVTLSAQNLAITSLASDGLIANASGRIEQAGSVQVNGSAVLNANEINLGNQANQFNGNVLINSTSGTTLHANGELNISGSAAQLNLTAAEVTQSAALTVAGSSILNTNHVNLVESDNDFAGIVELAVTGAATLSDMNGLAVSGSAGTATLSAINEVHLNELTVESLNITAASIAQNGTLIVQQDTSLNASAVQLADTSNDFGGNVELRNVDIAELTDEGELSLSGQLNNLIATARNTTQSAQTGPLTVNNTATFNGENVELMQLGNVFGGQVVLNLDGRVELGSAEGIVVSGRAASAVFSVDSIRQGTTEADALNVPGQTRINNSNSVQLNNAANRFGSTIVLQNAGAVNLNGNNILAIQGSANDVILTTGASGRIVLDGLNANSLSAVTTRIDQTDFLNVTGTSALSAQHIDLTKSGNNQFGSTVTLASSESAAINTNGTLTVSGNVTSASFEADSLIFNGLTASHALAMSAGSITQSMDFADALYVQGETRINNAGTVILNNSANDFQGNMVLDVSGTAIVTDANVLNVSGQLNGAVELRAQSIEQTSALITNSSVLLQADRVDLSNLGNMFKGLVRVEGASETTLSSEGTLRVEGVNLGALDLQAQVASLGELGELQLLDVAAAEVHQTAVLNVLGDTNLRSGRVVLNNPENDFVGKVTVQNPDSANSSVSIADKNDLSMQGENLAMAARVLGNFELKANNVELGSTRVDGASQIELTGALIQSRSVILNNATLTAAQINLTNSSNQFNGITEVQSGGAVALGTSGSLNVDTNSSSGTLALNVGGDAEVRGMQVQFAGSQVDGELAVSANQISQIGGMQVGGDAGFESIGGEIDLQHAANRFRGTVSASAEQIHLSTAGDMQLLNLNSRGGQLTADGRMLLLGTIEQTGGALTFTAKGVSSPLSSADIALLLPPSLDVFSSKEAVNPFTGLGRITIASPMIHQRSGQLLTTAGATTQFISSENGSVVLTQNNQINGQLGVLAGQSHGQSFTYVVDRGASLFAVNNDVRLNIGGQGAEADLIAVRARGLATQGSDAVVRARMPYNDLAVGTARSYAGLTLSIPLGGVNGQPGGLATFGESSGAGQSAGTGAIRVEVGDTNRPDLGGFLTVLPFEGSNLLPGQVVYLAGPESTGTRAAFFYDGARSLGRIPVVYNGTLLLSPQESAALTTAQGAVVLARQEQTRSVVRTENVAGKIINGVVVEVGPGRPATEGDGGAAKPATCNTEASDLSCAP